jgi:isopentenyl diphosphate isomerase/L-lactate dehydrogenase-like FMN-dependent dehydrogenase
MPLLKTVAAISEYQQLAKEKLGADAYAYFASGSDDEITLKNNIKALKDIYLTPRVLVDMAQFSTKTTIFG